MVDCTCAGSKEPSHGIQHEREERRERESVRVCVSEHKLKRVGRREGLEEVQGDALVECPKLRVVRWDSVQGAVDYLLAGEVLVGL